MQWALRFGATIYPVGFCELQSFLLIQQKYPSSVPYAPVMNQQLLCTSPFVTSGSLHKKWSCNCRQWELRFSATVYSIGSSYAAEQKNHLFLTLQTQIIMKHKQSLSHIIRCLIAASFALATVISRVLVWALRYTQSGSDNYNRFPLCRKINDHQMLTRLHYSCNHPSTSLPREPFYQAWRCSNCNQSFMVSVIR